MYESGDELVGAKPSRRLVRATSERCGNINCATLNLHISCEAMILRSPNSMFNIALFDSFDVFFHALTINRSHIDSSVVRLS